MDYQKAISEAINSFWLTRETQHQNHSNSDTGTRSAVTGGKQLDGFATILTNLAIEVGVPREYIYTKDSNLPGFFRPTKNWDFLIITPDNKLLVCVEMKSQVGSFGNNFNNRVEEVIGSSVDLWTAFRELAFNNREHAIRPWLGYILVVEQSKKSTSVVKIGQSHFSVFDIFQNTSYLDRYSILCRRLVIEGLYNNSALIWTSNENNKIVYGELQPDISITAFLDSFKGFLVGKLSLFARNTQ